jgi:radical SAM protein with 4Fe4S-binding SPASM domain
MKKIGFGHFYGWISNKKAQYPLEGQIELTYRCNFNCIHCYCKGSEDKEKELTTVEFKRVLDEIQKEGCVGLTLTGGEPLLRDDFLELYAYAKKKGFLVTLFSNGYGFNKEIINYLTKLPPFSIEITLNSITKKIYEKITQKKDAYFRVKENINKLVEKKLPLTIKSNLLKQNKCEIGKIKNWAERILGKPAGNKYRFKYDPIIFPQLSGDKSPCKYRLSFEEILGVVRQDKDMWQEYKDNLHFDLPEAGRRREFLYHCNTWMKQFSINPYGRLKFCELSDKFSVDLKNTSFKEGFYKIFPKVLKARFKTNSKCRECSLRPICYWCPARAYLETGNEEAPVPYYCELAKKFRRQIHEKSILQ